VRTINRVEAAAEQIERTQAHFANLAEAA